MTDYQTLWTDSNYFLRRKVGWLEISQVNIAMNKERIAGLFFIFVGLFAIYNSINLPFGTWGRPGVGVYPFILSILSCIVGVLIFVSGKGMPKIGRGWFLGKKNDPWKIVLLTAALVATFERLGFLVVSILYLFGLFFWVCRFRLWGAMGLSLVLTAASWYFFDKVLSVHLPVGLLGF